MKKLMAVGFVLGLAAVSQAQLMQVDFGLTGGTTQTNWTPALAAAGTDNDFGTLSVTENGVTMEITANRWKNRNALTGTFAGLSDMLRNYGGAEVAQTATVSLTMAIAGTYDVVLYHHESSRSASQGANLTLTDANGTQSAEFVSMSFGTAPTSISKTVKTVVSDGINPVIFSYDNSDGDGTHAFAINGIEVIPEPATLGLIAFSGFGIVLLRRLRV